MSKIKFLIPTVFLSAFFITIPINAMNIKGRDYYDQEYRAFYNSTISPLKEQCKDFEAFSNHVEIIQKCIEEYIERLREGKVNLSYENPTNEVCNIIDEERKATLIYESDESDEERKNNLIYESDKLDEEEANNLILSFLANGKTGVICSSSGKKGGKLKNFYKNASIYEDEKKFYEFSIEELKKINDYILDGIFKSFEDEIFKNHPCIEEMRRYINDKNVGWQQGFDGVCGAIKKAGRMFVKVKSKYEFMKVLLKNIEEKKFIPKNKDFISKEKFEIMSLFYDVQSCIDELKEIEFEIYLYNKRLSDDDFLDDFSYWIKIIENQSNKIEKIKFKLNKYKNVKDKEWNINKLMNEIEEFETNVEYYTLGMIGGLVKTSDGKSEFKVGKSYKKYMEGILNKLKEMNSGLDIYLDEKGDNTICKNVDGRYEKFVSKDGLEWIEEIVDCLRELSPTDDDYYKNINYMMKNLNNLKNIKDREGKIVTEFLVDSQEYNFKDNMSKAILREYVSKFVKNILYISENLSGRRLYETRLYYALLDRLTCELIKGKNNDGILRNIQCVIEDLKILLDIEDKYNRDIRDYPYDFEKYNSNKNDEKLQELLSNIKSQESEIEGTLYNCLSYEENKGNADNEEYLKNYSVLEKIYKLNDIKRQFCDYCKDIDRYLDFDDNFKFKESYLKEEEFEPIKNIEKKYNELKKEYKTFLEKDIKCIKVVEQDYELYELFYRLINKIKDRIEQYSYHIEGNIYYIKKEFNELKKYV